MDKKVFEMTRGEKRAWLAKQPWIGSYLGRAKRYKAPWPTPEMLARFREQIGG